MAIFTDPCPRDNRNALATLLGTAIASLGPVLVDWMFKESSKR